jgi:hemerythrin-like domain-containing protein
MKIIGPLMIEHRVIERMFKLLDDELSFIQKENNVHGNFIEAAIIFLKMYADKCHHGKEENILFRELAKKTIADEYKVTMGKLIEDHKKGHSYVALLEKAYESFISGDLNAIFDIKLNLQNILNLYPPHIKLENEHFFLYVMPYFSEQENKTLLDEMVAFDKKMDSQKYIKIIDLFSKKKRR